MSQEITLNSRPISYVSSDDMEEPLTHSHLLVGHRLLSLPDPLCAKDLDQHMEKNSLHVV